MAGLGALILTVGPSGAGKDALIAGAMQRLGGTGRFHVARRAVTRPEGAGGEDHIPMTPEAFAQAEADGGFLLSWRAHGLCYGIPREPASRMRETGVAVIANVSRTVLEAARSRLQPIAIVHVTAPPEALARRLAQRGRETAADIKTRIARSATIAVAGCDVHVVRNDGDLNAGITAMTAALEAASTAEWQAAE